MDKKKERKSQQTAEKQGLEQFRSALMQMEESSQFLKSSITQEIFTPDLKGMQMFWLDNVTLIKGLTFQDLGVGF